MGTAVLAEPGTKPLVQRNWGDFVSVFQLQHERAVKTHIRSRVVTSWYAGRLDAVSQSVSQSIDGGRPRYGRGAQTKRRHGRQQWCLFRKGTIN